MQIEKTRDVSLWINGSIMIEIEKLDNDLFRAWIFYGDGSRNCSYWQDQQVQTMKNSGFLQVVD